MEFDFTSPILEFVSSSTDGISLVPTRDEFKDKQLADARELIDKLTNERNELKMTNEFQKATMADQDKKMADLEEKIYCMEKLIGPHANRKLGSALALARKTNDRLVQDTQIYKQRDQEWQKQNQHLRSIIHDLAKRLRETKECVVEMWGMNLSSFISGRV
jgi:hypothetical protein